MRQHADERGVDILLVDTGDRVDGNGLYDGSSPKGKYTYDIFKQQHIDIICTGNHELYEADAADREYTKTVPNFKGNYLASNLDIINPKSGERVPLAPRYRKFTTKNQGIRVLAFGFLFDFTGNANNTFVQPVEETVKEPWFREAIREDVDIFVVIGHVDLRSPEYKAIYTAIRDHNWDTPIQFFGGHSHIRNFMSYDPNAYALESGRYMETIGWLAIDGVSSGGKKDPKEVRARASTTYKRRYIDNNLFGYYHHTGLNKSTFPTELGKNVSETIRRARKAMGLDELFGCAPQDYYLNRAEYPSNNSILSLLDTQILPNIIIGEDRSDIPRLAIINTGGIRFDIFQGPFTKDTVYIVCPFSNGFEYIRDVPYAAAKNLLALLNNGGPIFEGSNLQNWVLAPPEQRAIRQNVVVDAHAHGRHYYQPNLQNPLSPQSSNDPALVPGYTTKDDAGEDGDDTLHSPISFYRVPNCIQSEIAFPEDRNPEKVDLVFLSFIKPWVLLGMRFLGQAYNATDVLPYMEDKSFSSLLGNWMKEHWPYDC
jgi:hypothetical protein